MVEPPNFKKSAMHKWAFVKVVNKKTGEVSNKIIAVPAVCGRCLRSNFPNPRDEYEGYCRRYGKKRVDHYSSCDAWHMWGKGNWKLDRIEEK